LAWPPTAWLAIKKASYLGNNAHPQVRYHPKILTYSAACIMVRALEISLCLSSNHCRKGAGFPSVTVGSPAYPKRAAAEEAEGGIVREVLQCSVPQETPFH